MQLSSLEEEVKELLAREEADSSSICNAKSRSDADQVIPISSDSEEDDSQDQPPGKRSREFSGNWDVCEVSVKSAFLISNDMSVY